MSRLLTPGPSTPSFRLAGARSPEEVAAALVDHLCLTLGYPGSALVLLDPRDGHLRGLVRPPGGARLLVGFGIDPLVSGPFARALRAGGPSRQGLVPEDLAAPLEGTIEMVAAPIPRMPPESDPSGCARVDCPERSRRLGVCGGGAMPEEGWTRDRLTCGLMPIVGLAAVFAAEGEPPLERRAEALLEAFALEIAPLLCTFRLQEAFHDAEYFREDLLDSVTEALIATDARGDVLLVNRAAEELTGVERHTAIGRPLEVIFRDAAGGLSAARATLRDGEPRVAVERRIIRADGVELVVRVTTTPITARGWGVRGALVAFADVTPLKKMETEIRRLDRLATLGRFTSAVAHEVRNPLGGILAGVQYLKTQKGNSAALEEHLSFIESETHRLDRIVADLSDASTARSARCVPTTLAPIMQLVETALEADAASRGVTLRARDEAPDALVDPDLVQQVLLNLCKNAIEACGPGNQVEQLAELVSAGGKPMVRLSVTDDGPGISDGAREHLFEPFFTTKARGTGLGLYVCHALAERHGTNLEIETRPGRTCFSMLVPTGESRGDA